MTAFWKYTLARLGLFVVAFAAVGLVVFIWVDVNELTVLFAALIALVISAVASIFLLAGLRNDVAESLSQRAQRISARIEESRNAEDVD